ncbi:MAG: DUF2608 domain-containing protein, partial [Candidatus Berkiella sp.]
MNKLFKLSLIASLLLFPLALLAHPLSKIHTIQSMQEIEKYIDHRTLVIFDLDHTVFEGKNYGYGHANWYYDEIDRGKAKGKNEKEIIFKIFPHWLVSQKDKSAHVKPVETLTPALIAKLQKKNNIVMSLTARQVPLVDITIKHLVEINIDFSSNTLPDTIIHGFYAPTLMKSGIIFTSEYNDKGEVLKAYLNKLNIHPQKIVFVDDSKRHLQAVTKFYPHIEVIGLHYPLVAQNKRKNWDGNSAHDDYCNVAKNHPELSDYALDCV